MVRAVLALVVASANRAVKVVSTFCENFANLKIFVNNRKKKCEVLLLLIAWEPLGIRMLNEAAGLYGFAYVGASTEGTQFVGLGASCWH